MVEESGDVLAMLTSNYIIGWESLDIAILATLSIGTYAKIGDWHAMHLTHGRERVICTFTTGGACIEIFQVFFKLSHYVFN